jgi:hypothetical protein
MTTAVLSLWVGINLASCSALPGVALMWEDCDA